MATVEFLLGRITASNPGFRGGLPAKAAALAAHLCYEHGPGVAERHPCCLEVPHQACSTKCLSGRIGNNHRLSTKPPDISCCTSSRGHATAQTVSKATIQQ